MKFTSRFIQITLSNLSVFRFWYSDFLYWGCVLYRLYDEVFFIFEESFSRRRHQVFSRSVSK